MPAPNEPNDPNAPFLLNPTTTFLNHGSFGACPRAVLEAQSRWRLLLEEEPVHFFHDVYPQAIDATRAALAAFLQADPDGLVFLHNATTAVSTVLRGLNIGPGDHLLATSHGYGACNLAISEVARQRGADLELVTLPWPVEDPAEVIEALWRARRPGTKLLLVDHITSPTGLVLPVHEIVRRFEEAGTSVLVDGAHAPGQVPLNLQSLGASWYTGNLHKWVCAPKGAAFLAVRTDRRETLRPLVISHGYNATLPSGRRCLRSAFDWAGTDDPSAWLAVTTALETIPALGGGSWERVMERNRAMSLRARVQLSEALGVPLAAPESMVGAMAAVPLPGHVAPAPEGLLGLAPLQRSLMTRHHIQVPVIPFPAPPRALVRVSAHLHNRDEDYARLATALRQELG